MTAASSIKQQLAMPSLWLTCLVLLTCFPLLTNAILPTAQLTVNPGTSPSSSYTLLASQASFGPLSPMATTTTTMSGDNNNNNNEYSKNPPRKLVLAPSSNPLLCQNVTTTTTTDTTTTTTNTVFSNAILVVPRGECTYQSKTLRAQQLGAKGVVIYNTLASRYSINTTAHDGEKYPSYSTNDILFPQEFYDYDCGNNNNNNDVGIKAMIPTVDLQMHPLPYNAPHNDVLLSGDTSDNLCRLHAQGGSASFDNFCESQRCLITEWNDNATTAQACCAWDLHLWLYADNSMTNDDADNVINIPTIFLTMRQGDQLLETIKNNNNAIVMAVMASRWRSDYNLSSIIIWMLGVFVAALAAYGSAADYHTVLKKLRARARSSNNNANRQASNNNNNNNNNRPMVTRSPMQEETLELEPIHAVGFVVMASTSLFVLFYFKIYNVVKVMYAIGCSNAVVQVITYPLLSKLLRKTSCSKPKLLYKSSEFGDITNWDLFASALAYLWGMTWLYMALFVQHSDNYTFFWVTQDVLGTCMCIVFLGIIQLNSIQVASILLIVAFLYDIFFVFVTPYIFDKSIMITVATSGGPPTADPLWCEKYPSDVDCQGGDPLPMLLTIPRIFDYQGGSSLLGLGDIVLPGLLLSFAARLDAAKSLVAMVSGGRHQVNSSLECQSGTGAACFCGCCGCCGCCCTRNGGYYFVPVVVSYAIGLLMANIAVYVMNMGQPALLYLVPCTLGTISFLGWRRQELRSLWDGPGVLRTADRIVYGTPQQQQQARPTSTATITSTTTETGTSGGGVDEEEGPEEELPDDEGDVPLLQTSTASSSSAAASD